MALATTFSLVSPAAAVRSCRQQQPCRVRAPLAASKRSYVRSLNYSQRAGNKVFAAGNSVEAGSSEVVPSAGEPLRELTKEDFYPFLEASDKLVVVDFYTDWCGPCKMILPQLVELNAEDGGIELVKFNCNKENKDLGKALGIRVAPTFHLYKGGSKVAEMTGAKVDKLKALIAENK